MSFWPYSSAALLLATTALARLPPIPDNLSDQDIAVIQELYHLWSTKSESIWPGASKVQIPILYIKSNTEYAIGFPGHVTGFAPARTPSELQGSVQVRKRTLATNLSASFPVEGTATVVIGCPDLLKKSPEEWVITASHEMFHVFQAANGSYAKISTLGISSRGIASWQLTFPFPYSNADVMRLIHLQGYTLWLAATSKDDSDVKYNIGTAIEIADIYRTFLDRLAKPQDHLYSEFQEWNEGVAAYTEYRFAEAAAINDYMPASSFRRLLGFHGYDRLWKGTYQNWPYLVKHAGRAARDRNAFYHLGMGKALALDRVDPGWKRQYFASGVWLDDLLNISMSGMK
ncbi:MAG: hypothetical protein ACR2JB_02790 [Bryobacteraceae bacterium]